MVRAIILLTLVATSLAINGYLVSVQAELQNGVDVNAKDKTGETPLHWAVAKGNKEAAELLIAKGADVNAKNVNGKTPLDWAETAKHLEIVALLRKHGGKFGITDRIMESLHELTSSMSHGLELTDEKHKFLRQKKEQLVDEHIGISILVAARYGDIKAVKQHLEVGTDVNKKDYLEHEWTPLHLAAKEGHKEIVELLIAKGADVNAKDAQSLTPLHLAVKSDHREIAELLIAKGADVNAKNDEGDTPLHYAKTKEIYELLIANRADVNAKNDSGRTPLPVLSSIGAYPRPAATPRYAARMRTQREAAAAAQTNDDSWSIGTWLCIGFFGLMVIWLFDDGTSPRIVGAVTRPMDDSGSDDFGGMM